MSIRPPLFRIVFQSARLLLLGSILLGGWGCNFIHNYGSGTHLDEPRERTERHGTAKASTMQAEVTTNAAAQVVAVRFVRSSGSNAVDNYVADSIGHNWPGGPSTVSLVEIGYKPGTGFSDPKLLSTRPAP